MNILFIYSLNNIKSSAKPLGSSELIQFGISYISSVLKKNNNDTQLLVLGRVSGKENEVIINERIRKFCPKIICFTAVSTEYPFILTLAKYIREKYPSIKLLIGGAHVSLNPEGILNHFDALCIGEGEYPTLEYVAQLEKGLAPSNISNLWINHDGKIEKNPTRPLLQDLDQLPFPDREMWQEWLGEDPGTVHTVLLGRGCPFNCSYCCNHALRKLAEGTYTRYRSPDSILSEIGEVVQKYLNKNNRREIYLEVETIGVNKDWALELCSKLENYNKTLSEPLTFGANLRISPNLDLEPIFNAFKRANFRFVNIGLESGSERVRREILKRNYSNEDIINAVKLARKYGLQISFLNMMGLPGETPADFAETIKMNRLCLPDWTSVSIFYPYPGTKLYDRCKERGLLGEAVDTGMERERAVLALPNFSKKAIENGCAWFEYNVYRGQRPLLSLLRKAIGLKIRSNSFLFHLYWRLKKSRARHL